MTEAICVIPARMASSRFPGKPLKPLLGMPLVLHVWHRCRIQFGADKVIVATCDTEIADAVAAAGGRAIMTADTHEGCVDRTVEAVEKSYPDLGDRDLVLMVQGDEVLVNPVMLAQIVVAYGRSRPPVVNLASRIYRTEDHDDANVVKVVADQHGKALLFSRSAIPSRSRAKGPIPMFQQTGVIGFAREFLQRFGTMARTPLEVAEAIDMLRVIENGLPVALVTTEVETIGVDTEADRARAEIALRGDAWTTHYLTKEL